MAFPTLALLDDFNRAGNSSLGANWAEGVNGKGTDAEISSSTPNCVSVPGGGSSSICAYTGTGAPNDFYVACQDTQFLVASAVNDAAGLAVTKVSNTAQGYHFEQDITTVSDVGITFWNDASGLQVGGTTVVTGWGYPAAGDLQGFVARDTGTSVALEVWLKKVAGSWTQVATSTMSGGDYIAGPYYVGLRVKYGSEYLDDFAGGVGPFTITIPPISAPMTAGKGWGRTR